MDEPLIWYEGADLSNRRTLHANHQGSIIAVADAMGRSMGTNSYDPYGIPGTTNAGRFQYTGQIWLSELGLYHYKARAYSPSLGRFLQTDPIGTKDDLNLYAYVGNDPVNRTDPTGLADVNLLPFGSSLREKADSVDLPNTFTIAAHGGELGARDNTVQGVQRYNPAELLELAHRNGYKQGQMTFLAACHLGSIPTAFRNPISTVYAQAYANLSGGRVIAAPGLLGWAPRAKDGSVTLKSMDGEGNPTPMLLFTPGRSSPTALGSTVTVNTRTGYASWKSGPEIGSLISRTHVKCVDPEKC